MKTSDNQPSKKGDVMKQPFHAATICCTNALFLLNCYAAMPPKTTNGILTLQTTSNTPVRIQAAWDCIRERATVIGNANDGPRIFINNPSYEFEDATITPQKPLKLYIKKQGTTFFAVAGYCNGQRVTRNKQIVLPVKDGATLIFEDYGQGDIAITPMPAIQILNSSSQKIALTLHTIECMTEKPTQNEKKSTIPAKEPRKLPWQHTLTTKKIELLAAATSIAKTPGNPTCYSFAPRFLFWNKEEPAWVTQKIRMRGKLAALQLFAHDLFPLDSRQTVLEFQDPIGNTLYKIPTQE